MDVNYLWFLQGRDSEILMGEKLFTVIAGEIAVTVDLQDQGINLKLSRRLMEY